MLIAWEYGGTLIPASGDFMDGPRARYGCAAVLAGKFQFYQ
jgi:hypothetical protein